MDKKSDTQDIWISLEEVSRMIGVKRETLRRHCKSGEYTVIAVDQREKKSYNLLLASLPLKYQERYLTSLANERNIEPEIEAEIYKRSPDWARQKADKYLILLNKTKNLKGKELKEYISFWNKNHPEMKTSYPRLMDAKNTYASEGIAGLLAQYGKNSGKTHIKDEWFDYFKSIYLKEGAPSLYSSWLITTGKFGDIKDIGIKDFPSLSAFRRMLDREVPKQSIFMARYGESAWNRKYGKYVERDYTNILAGEVWVSDHAQIDVAVLNDAGKVVFPWVTAWRDFKSGKWLGWLLHCESPNSDHIFQSFYTAALDFGLPTDIYIDNGKDYRAKDFAGGRKNLKVSVNEHRANSMLSMLGITPHFALPYNAQTKPIERDFLKTKELFSKHIVGYRGGNVVERPEKLSQEIKSNKILEFSEFKNIFDDFVINILNKMPSKGKNHKGKSPDQLFTEEFKEKRVISKEALALFCKRTSKTLTIGRNGVKDNELNVTYWAEWMSGIKGEKVYLRRDIQNYNEAWVFRAENDEYIGKASIAELVPALAQTPVEKAELKEALAQKKKDKKIARAYIKTLDEIDPFEKISNMKLGIAALTPLKDPVTHPIVTKISTPLPNTLSNAAMGQVIAQHKKLSSEGLYNSSVVIPIHKAKQKIYIFESDKLYEESREVL